MATATDVAVVPLRLPKALASRGRVGAADAPSEIVEKADVDAALDVYDLCIGCKGVEGAIPGEDEDADLTLRHAQQLSSLVLQYIEAR
jgi:hypothetical protein